MELSTPKKKKNGNREGGFIFFKEQQYSKLPIEEWSAHTVDACATKNPLIVNTHDNITILSSELTANFKPSNTHLEFPYRLFINDIETDIYSNGRKDTDEKWTLSYLNDNKEAILVKVMWKSGKTQYFELNLNSKEEMVEISNGQLDEVARYSKIIKKNWNSIEKLV